MKVLQVARRDMSINWKNSPVAYGKVGLNPAFAPSYLALGGSESERQKAYVEYVLATIPEYEIKLIRESLQRGQLTGSEQFCEEISRKIGIRFSNRGQGALKINKDVPFSA